MKRRIICILTAVIIALTAFPFNAAAAEKYGITVGGVEITSENAADILSDGTASYDKKSNTLILSGAKITAAPDTDGFYYGIKADTKSPLTLNVKKDSEITCSGEELCGILTSGSLNVTGKQLDIICKTCKTAYGIACGDSLTFKNAIAEIVCVYASDTGLGVYAKNALTFDDSDTRIFGSTNALYAGGSFTLMNGTHYMGNAEPSANYPKGYEYFVSEKVKYYTVVWKNYDGTVLETDKKVREGSTPVYNGKTPKRKSDGSYSYTFKGWNKKIVPVYSDTVYKAVFTKKALPSPANNDKKPASTEENEKIINNTDTDKTDIKASSFLPMMPKATGKKKKIVLKWKKYNGADGYIIYGAPCGSKLKKLKTVTSPNKTKLTFKKLKKGKYYKYVVVAYKKSGGKKVVLANSKSVHCTTLGGKKGNPSAVKYKKSSINLKKGKAFKLKPKLVSDKRVAVHISKFRYESSAPAVASVNSKGKIKAKKKGSAYIYIIAQNGKYKKIKITVK